MQLLNIVLVVLCCWAGVAHGQGKGDPCPDDTCDQDLLCQEGKCRAKIGDACTDGTIDECVVTAKACDTTPCACPEGATATDDKAKCDCTDSKKVVSNRACALKAGETCQAGGGDACLENAACTQSKCECSANYVANSEKTKCVGVAGEGCTGADDCLTGASCTGQICVCPKVTSADKKQCQEKIGDACDETKACVANAACSSDKCACNTDYLPSYDMTACAKAPGKSCSAQIPCGENAECTDDKCVCKTGFASKDGERCGKKVDESCQGNKDCVQNAECDQQKCKCKDGYSDDGNKFCSGASAVMASLTLLLAALVASLWM